mmetsp:Transcript_13214/g.22641  ORF Transcript_13214/g.22641 Transcript_13214/m.22641 type:complete len:235 (-) Transcript_13214:100-804(-)
MITTSNDENIGLTSGESVSLPVLHSNNGEGSIVLLKVDKLSNTTSVVSLGNHNHGTHLELVNVRHLSSGDIHLNSVVDTDIRVRVTKSAAIVGHGNRNLPGSNIDLLDAAELVSALSLLNTVEDEASLGIVKKTEAIARLLKLNNVHESSRVVGVRPDLPIDLHATLHANLLALLSGECILETLTKDDSHGKTFALLVGAGGGLGGPDAAHLAHVPVAGRIEALEVLLRSARHG